MPTNVYRKLTRERNSGANPKSGRTSAGKPAPTPGKITITVGRTKIRAQLADTPTAQAFWRALPVFSVAETWGEAVHFEVPAPTGRDRTARLNAQPGDICFWTSDNRVIIPFGPTPISRPGEIRLPQLCNVFAKALDDPKVLNIVTPGEKVTVTAEKA